LKHAIHHVLHQAVERYLDWRLGINTQGSMWADDINQDNGEQHPYIATGYREFNRIISGIVIKPGKDVFLDYGSGLGRVVVMAARYPFRKVIGVELSSEMTRLAKQNVAHALPKLACTDIELLVADAAEYDVPQDVTVVFFWNPFGSVTLGKVLDKVNASVNLAPRRVRILYVNAPGSSQLTPILRELPWIYGTKETTLRSGLKLTECWIGHILKVI
jgi:SAM-dependent methyltransferase